LTQGKAIAPKMVSFSVPVGRQLSLQLTCSNNLAVYQFKDKKFSTGRFYPCIGARTTGKGDEFKIQTTICSSPEHPFHYKGPYDGLLLRTEWDDESMSANSSKQNSDTDSDYETE
jgi:hypothetical protein